MEVYFDISNDLKDVWEADIDPSYTDEDHDLIGVRPHLYHGLEKFLRENMF